MGGLAAMRNRVIQGWLVPGLSVRWCTARRSPGIDEGPRFPPRMSRAAAPVVSDNRPFAPADASSPIIKESESRLKDSRIAEGHQRLPAKLTPSPSPQERTQAARTHASLMNWLFVCVPIR